MNVLAQGISYLITNVKYFASCKTASKRLQAAGCLTNTSRYDASCRSDTSTHKQVFNIYTIVVYMSPLTDLPCKLHTTAAQSVSSILQPTIVASSLAYLTHYRLYTGAYLKPVCSFLIRSSRDLKRCMHRHHL